MGLTACPSIEIKQLTKRYFGSSQQALNGVDLCIQKGEFFGLLGPNGCGKTTLFSILCGLLPPSSGTANVCGHPLNTEITQIRHKLGVIPQDIALYPMLSLRQNLYFFAKLYGLSSVLRHERIKKYLKIACLEDKADNLIIELSGGMKRRANLVAGMLHEPELIFLDEPTVGVDTVSRQVIFNALQSLNQAGKTIVYTTHYLEEAEQYCSKLALMRQGKIIASGSPQQLIAATPECQNLSDVFMRLMGIAPEKIV